MSQIKDYKNITHSQLETIKFNYINNYINIINNILQIPNEDLCWMNLVVPFIQFKNKFTELSFLQMYQLHKNKNIRDNCNKILIELYNFYIVQSMRKDIYNKFKYYSNNQYIKEKLNISIEESQYFDNIMIDYITNGINQPHLDYVNKIKKSINQLTFNFNKNINDLTNSTFILFKSDLEGLPAQYIIDRQYTEDSIIVTLNERDYMPIMEYANIRDIRKKFYILYNNRYNNENQDLVKHIISLKNEISKYFEYENYIDSNSRMLKLDNEYELIKKETSKYKKNIELLSKLAKLDNIDNLELYDINYYLRIYNKKIIKYYQLSNVISETFKNYERIYGINFKKVYDFESTLWDELIELYHIYDSETNIIGYFYLDLFQRIGKTNNIECIPFINRSDNIVPVATITCNFINNNLTLEQVNNFYNVFGDAMTHLNSKMTFSNLTFVNYNFTEPMTQIYISDLLKTLDINFYNELCANQSHELISFNNIYHLMYKLFKLKIYFSENLNNNNITEIFFTMQKEILMIEPPSEQYGTIAIHYLL